MTLTFIEKLFSHRLGHRLAGYVLATTCVCNTLVAKPAFASDASAAQRCENLAELLSGAWPDISSRLESAAFMPPGPAPLPPMAPPGTPTGDLPSHCDVVGVMQERKGIDGQRYAIRFHVRLPEQWNGRFLFEGGGGSNGEVGDAVGRIAGNPVPALVRGFAVVSQDSGHDNHNNSIPDKGGALAFGLDPQARANYGGRSLPPVTRAARALIMAFYGKAPEHSYFAGCSKGGQEGMTLAQQYPDLFDGIVASAPGIALPSAAINQASDTKIFASLAQSGTDLANTFSDADLALVSAAIMRACDGDDGLVDGIIGDFGRCGDDKVLPQLQDLVCTDEHDGDCLSAGQVQALRSIHQGATDSKGRALYSSFPWDSGWSSPGWRLWKIGSSDGRVPSLSVALGAPALALLFTTPPTIPEPGLPGNLAYQLAFGLDAGNALIHASNNTFPRSAWEDVAARSADLSAFRRHGGKLLLTHGVSDPVFSINETLQWYREVNQNNQGKAEQFVRVFPVPGMNHCGGGPATDSYDALTAVVNWVENGRAPERLEAKAGPLSPWPGRTRPLCAYPRVARYQGGDVESADSFSCEF